MELKQHALYVVYFSDRRVKVGITSDVDKRMAYYRQEAQRNRVSDVHWWAAVPFKDKPTALLAERLMCRTFADSSMTGHREWFEVGPQGFGEVIQVAEQVRAALADEHAAAIADLPFMARRGRFQGLAA